jgi:hypothetical protein
MFFLSPDISDYQAVARKLKIRSKFIIKMQEWQHVLFVVIKGVGARFVSKTCRAEYAQHIQSLEDLSDEEFEARKSAVYEKILAPHKPRIWPLFRKHTHSVTDIFCKTL